MNVATDGHLELHLVERTGAHEAEQYRAIALKLRSVLVGTAAPEPAVVVAPPPPPPAPPLPPAPAPTPTGPDLLLRAQPPAPAPPPRRMFVSVGYRLSTPFESATPRHALAVDGTLAIGRLFEVDLGTELAARRTQSQETDAAGGPSVDTISVFDWPITAGLRVVRRGARVTLGAGPFAALHLLWASASGGAGMQQMQQSAFTASGGAGAELIARAGLTGALSGEVRLYGEVPLPTTGYTLRGGGEVLNLGARAGIGLGLAFPAP